MNENKSHGAVIAIHRESAAAFAKVIDMHIACGPDAALALFPGGFAGLPLPINQSALAMDLNFGNKGVAKLPTPVWR
jgi:hypothetical protein